MKNTKRQSRRKGFVEMTVSEEAYQRELAAGVEPELAFKPGKHKLVRGGFLKRHKVSADQVREIVQSEKTRTAISIKVPLDVLEFFKAEAGKTGKPYQTQINDVLRAHIDSELSGMASDPVITLRHAARLINAAAGRIRKRRSA
jgi:uncharacterized protein (DUF4415 family)